LPSPRRSLGRLANGGFWTCILNGCVAVALEGGIGRHVDRPRPQPRGRAPHRAPTPFKYPARRARTRSIRLALRALRRGMREP
jgi:hypothetical protein